MTNFETGARVKVVDFASPGSYIKKGMEGTVVAYYPAYEQYEVNFDNLSTSNTTLNKRWVAAADTAPEVVYRIEGPKGFTECLSETQVKGLVSAGILFHNATIVYDNELLKIYQNEPDVYVVTDRRTGVKSLEERFPKDN